MKTCFHSQILFQAHLLLCKIYYLVVKYQLMLTNNEPEAYWLYFVTLFVKIVRSTISLNALKPLTTKSTTHPLIFVDLP